MLENKSRFNIFQGLFAAKHNMFVTFIASKCPRNTTQTVKNVHYESQISQFKQQVYTKKHWVAELTIPLCSLFKAYF